MRGLGMRAVVARSISANVAASRGAAERDDGQVVIAVEELDVELQRDAGLAFDDGVVGHDPVRTDTYKDAKDRTIRTVYDDGSFTETLYSIGSQPITNDQEGDDIGTPTNAEGWTWYGNIPNGGSEVVQIAQRQASDPLVVTYQVYDKAGKLTDVWLPAVTDADPNSTTYEDSVRPHWSYEHDAGGNQTAQIGPREQPAYQTWLSGYHTTPFTDDTRFGYDQNGNEVRRILPDGEQETFTYDQYGRQATHVDFDGNVATYAYLPANDAHAGRLEQVVYVGAAGSGKATQTVTYAYDDLGRLASVADASGTTTYSYDNTGRLIEEDTPEGVIHYAYDPATGRHTETYTDYTDTLYDYDSLGRLWHVTVAMLNGEELTTPLVTTYGYDAAGNKTSEELPNGVATTYDYDDLNRLTDLLTQHGSTTLFSQNYILNADGTRASVDETQLQADGTTVVTSHTDWMFDALGRLVGEAFTSTASGQDYTDVFAYDLSSNRMERDHTGLGGGADETITYTYNGNDQLTAEDSTVGGETYYMYDDNGSQISSTHGGATTSYGYDVRNKMVGYSGPSGTATYVYDDAGNRVQETAGGATTYYPTDNKNPTGYAQPIEAKLSLLGSPSMTYLIGKRVFAQANGSGVVSCFLRDGHGSTRALADASGVITRTLNYDAFGGMLNFAPATAGTVFLFGGDAVCDPASGLYLHGDGVRQRLGFRFVEMDVYAGNNEDALSLHKYLYARMNPTRYVNPSGKNILVDMIGTMLIGMGVTLIGIAIMTTAPLWVPVTGGVCLALGLGLLLHGVFDAGSSIEQQAPIKKHVDDVMKEMQSAVDYDVDAIMSCKPNYGQEDEL